MARSVGPIDRVREVAWRVFSRGYDAVQWVLARARRALDPLRSPANRDALLIGVAYVTGIAGLSMSLLGDPTDTTSRYGTAGIALMGISFVCLFVVSVSVLRATGGEVGGR